MESVPSIHKKMADVRADSSKYLDLDGETCDSTSQNLSSL